MTVPATTQPTRAGRSVRDHEEQSPPPRTEQRSGPAAPAGALDPGLVAILRCPLTGGALIPVDAARLMSDRPFRDGVHPVYPVTNGIACLRPPR